MTSFNFPSSSGCIRANPSPCSLDASAITVVFLAGSNARTTSGPERVSLSLENSFWCSSSQRKATFFLRSSLMCFVSWERSGMKLPSWLAKPRNLLISLCDLGAGKLVRAARLAGSGLIPCPLTMWPANVISCPISNFFLEMVMPAVLHFVRISFVRFSKSSGVSAHTMMSSTIFFANGRPSMTMSDLLHQMSELGDRPIGALRYTYLPEGSKKVVYFWLSLSSSTWKYPCTASSLAKYLAEGGIACSISRVHGKGCTGLLMNLLSWVKSVTRRTPPFGFWTKKPGLIHEVGSVTLAMIPCFTSFFMRLSASFCIACGTVRAVNVLVGFASGMRVIFIGSPLIGVTFMSSLRVRGNLA